MEAPTWGAARRPGYTPPPVPGAALNCTGRLRRPARRESPPHGSVRAGTPTPEATLILKVPFLLPPGFLPALGYPGGRQLVALYWEPCGDEACYDDGVTSACGRCDNWLYLDLVRQSEVSAWLGENGVRLGDSEGPATHWLVADALTGELWAAPRREAFDVVRRQGLSDERT